MSKNGKKSIDPTIMEALARAEELGIDTAFSRADQMKPCPIGSDGICCKNCAMGPCRLVKPGQVGICGATRETVVARNLARAVAAGAAAHSDHGRDLCHTLIAFSEGHAPDYQVRDVAKLARVAGYLGISVEGKSIEQLASEVGRAALAEFGRQEGVIEYTKRAPKKRQEIWEKTRVTPRGVDREVVEVLHRTHIGNDQKADHILQQAMRSALADGWGGSMLATDLSDILFGTPSAIQSEVGMGVLEENTVNIIVHGHEPTLSEMTLVATMDPEMLELAKSHGATGITLAGICCTANELLMRQGVPIAGNFLNQEPAILTGAVDAMVVDIQCIMQALAPLAAKFHTRLITTSPKADIEGRTVRLEFEETRALEIAKKIVRHGIEAFAERKGREVHIPKLKTPAVAGFSHEYIRYSLGGVYRGTFRAFNDAVMAGRLRGAAAIVGCNNPRVCHDEGHLYVARQLIKNDVLVVETGCSAIAAGKYGLLMPEAMAEAGHGLREVCEAVGIPPILHMGSCVDNTRILTLIAEVVAEGGLGDDGSQVPAVGLAPEWMSEKALSIASYVVGSGVPVIMGYPNVVSGSEEMVRYINEGWTELYGAGLEFIQDWDEMVRRTLEIIDARREALGLEPYDPDRFAKAGATWDEVVGLAAPVVFDEVVSLDDD
ncbi:MAG: anaerobic carbon-monoxide dehydrogenase catalytic subunit [Chloroflexota bacterium]